ncbi:hypothetical protein WJX74_002065 [Apatococcus lobatus]|uniref:NEDD8-activating enzyme E1 catalytic subunit n=1 Tax=Apatococcus lobatus TaxID=904363 RepID=A0AAW1RK63_9CHLO
MDVPGRWKDLDHLLTRPGNVVGPGFEPDPALRAFLHDDCRVLCVGAGGLGCELLKDLALSGFGQIDVIDMDTIDVSNLNRQFLFRLKDVGKPKAEVAAAAINQRVAGVHVTPHFCRIEEKPLEFYQQFQIIILGLDSLEARRYMNQVACSFLAFEEDGSPDLSTIKPMIDGGTEGFKGHARVILPGFTPCFECTLWLFPPQTKFPLCTLAETPRSPAHCIEYAHLIQWGQERPGHDFDADVEEHMRWVYDEALKRAAKFGIAGVSYQLTQGMDNYMMYVGTDGIYTHTVKYEKDAACLICSSGVPLHAPASSTLQQVIDQLQRDPRFEGKLQSPSVSCGPQNLYMHGIFEEETRQNLQKDMKMLIGGSHAILQVNDKKLLAPLRCRLTLSDHSDLDAEMAE